MIQTLAPKARAFENSTKDPLAAQRKVLLEYLARNRKTEYGLKYGFSGIKSIEEYQAKVPLNDCDSLQPYLDRMTKGEANVLVSDKVVFFGATSGTTNIPKLVPTTNYSEEKKVELTELWGYYILRDHPDLVKGKILAIVSPEVEGYTECGIPYGAESGHGYKDLPLFIRHFYVLPYEVFEIKNYDARYYSILRIGMEHNVTNIATLNPNTIILLCQRVEKWQDSIIDDIDKGALSENLDIPDDIRRKVARRLKPNPERAGELKAILKTQNVLLPKYFWPNLKLIECWKGGTMKLYLKNLPPYFGGVPVRDMGCLSTEARSSIPMSDDRVGGVLAVQTNFYEFIPKKDIGKREKRILLCDQLKKGEDYFIVVTTAGGLYRYNIDDIIRVDSFFNNTPVIEFVQKGLDVTSLAGEKIYESQVDEAINRIIDRHKLSVAFFSAVAQPEETPHYEFLMEFSRGGLPAEEKKRILTSIDEELCRQNREYEFVRNAQLLGPPVLKVVKKGGFEKYRNTKIEAGAHDAQFKVPELTADTGFQKNFDIEEEVRLCSRS